jgi:hypothetical protein
VQSVAHLMKLNAESRMTCGPATLGQAHAAMAPAEQDQH